MSRFKTHGDVYLFEKVSFTRSNTYIRFEFFVLESINLRREPWTSFAFIEPSAVNYTVNVFKFANEQVLFSIGNRFDIQNILVDCGYFSKFLILFLEKGNNFSFNSRKGRIEMKILFLTLSKKVEKCCFRFVCFSE